MTSTQALTRKYRSSQFPDIVGQYPIVRTLMNAIQTSRVHHAYLFTGSRGIGKTSIARIFSKVLRCENKRAENKAGKDWIVSCDNCSQCREITLGNSMDVLEIDGASNNGVDAIREIREAVRFMPASGKYKIYIIDEVHMLTTAAFNALLKTLEEPPEHIVFIFATTEPHKIPATILSRCQRFDYRRITSAQIQARLLEVSRAEQIVAHPGSLQLIAEAAEGSMRDALSLLDQAIAYSGATLTAASIRECIGLVEGRVLLALLKAVFERKPHQAIALSNEIYQQGHDLKNFLKGLIEVLHHVLLLKVEVSETELPEMDPADQEALRSLLPLRTLEEIETFFQIFHHGLDTLSRSPQPKAVLDILLIKCSTADLLVEVSDVPHTSNLPQQTRKPSDLFKPQSSSLAPLPLAGALEPIVTASPTPGDAQVPEPAPTPAPSLSWEGFVEFVRRARPLLASLIEHSIRQERGTQENSKEMKLFFAVSDQYKAEQVQNRTVSDQMGLLAQQYYSTPIFITTSVENTDQESLAQRRERERTHREETRRTEILSQPMIKEAQALFNAPLKTLELREISNS